MRGNLLAKKLLAVLAIVVIVVAIICFELFNFGTNREVLDGLFGNVVFLTITAGAWLAAGAAFVDFGGLSRIFTSEVTMRQESLEIKAITIAWLFASVFNAWLTFVWVLNRLEAGGANNLPARMQDDSFTIAVAIAAFVFLVRMVLIFGGATIGDKMLRLPFSAPSLRRSGGTPMPAPVRPGNTYKFDSEPSYPKAVSPK